MKDETTETAQPTPPCIIFRRRRVEETFYRKNEIWREKILKFKGGKVIETELVTKNFARVAYIPDNFIEQ